MSKKAQVSGGVRPRAVAYVRVSKEREGMISPELQRHEIETFAKRQGIQLVDVFEDLDMSGREFGKRKVQQIIAGIQAGEYELVLLWKWSRWGRNLLQSRIYLAAVEAAGGTVRAATEDIDTTTAVGKFTRDQMLAIAELVSNQIGEGWKEAHEYRRRNGLPHNGFPRFGYTYADGAYHPDPVAGPELADAYHRYIAGESTASIAEDWNSRSLLTIRGKMWEGSSLARMMDTGFAAGLIRERTDKPGRTTKGQSRHDYDVWRDGAHEALIPRDVWEAYRAARDHRADKPPRLAAPTQALTGLLVCGVCGSRMIAQGSGEGSRRWRCRAERTFKTHEPLSIANDGAIEELLKWAVAEAMAPVDVEDARTRLKKAKVAQSDRDMHLAEVDRLTKKRRRLTDLYTDGDIEREDYQAQKAAIARDLEAAQRGLAKAEAQATTAEATPAKVLQSLVDGWDKLDGPALNRMLTKVLAKVEVAPGRGVDGRLDITTTWAE